MNKSKQKSKRSDRNSTSKDDSYVNESKVGSVPASPASTPNPTPQASPQVNRPTPTAWFTTEIQQMMHGFGDSRKPLAESAAIIEETVHHQLVTMLYQAAEVGSTRNARFLSIEDFLFLLRKDKIKLRRLIRYFTMKDMKMGALKVEEEEQIETEGKQPPKKKRKICYDFLSSIDQTGELVSLFDDDSLDDVKHERALRAELMTRQMDVQQYKEFCEARQASFAARFKSQRFKDWLMAGVNIDPKPNPLAIEVLAYFAYEIVAQIVDLALLVRRDMRATVDDPFRQTLPSVCVNHDNVLGLQALTAVKGPSTTGSPGASPPSTPTTPSPMPTTPGSSSGHTPNLPSSGSNSSGKSKSKKRKKSGSQSSRDLLSSQAIQPNDIREALRRYSQSTGPFADFSKCPLIPSRNKILCA